MTTFSHRILTENINRPLIVDILSKYFDSFTLTEHKGYWKGVPESSLSVEVIGAAYADVLRAASAIRTANNQDAVLVFSVNGKQTVVSV